MPMLLYSNATSAARASSGGKLRLNRTAPPARVLIGEVAASLAPTPRKHSARPETLPHSEPTAPPVTASHSEATLGSKLSCSSCGPWPYAPRVPSPTSHSAAVRLCLPTACARPLVEPAEAAPPDILDARRTTRESDGGTSTLAVAASSSALGRLGLSTGRLTVAPFGKAIGVTRLTTHAKYTVAITNIFIRIFRQSDFILGCVQTTG
mmetsp:Transcript_20895/g.39712  ORF Transcript_20895/g.39712 Transcript_20895/m.39712 type:complete len:208 (-) Transcript_20895:77-700(-)